MKLLLIPIFATAFLSALLWFESDERNYTPVQKPIHDEALIAALNSAVAGR
jgi:hypothetical protein